MWRTDKVPGEKLLTQREKWRHIGTLCRFCISNLYQLFLLAYRLASGWTAERPLIFVSIYSELKITIDALAHCDYRPTAPQGQTWALVGAVLLAPFKQILRNMRKDLSASEVYSVRDFEIFMRPAGTILQSVGEQPRLHRCSPWTVLLL